MQIRLLIQEFCSKYTHCVLVYKVIVPRVLVVYKLLLGVEGEEILNRTSRKPWSSEPSWVLKENVALVLGQGLKDQGPYEKEVSDRTLHYTFTILAPTLCD